MMCQHRPASALILRPSWNEGAVFRAGDGTALSIDEQEQGLPEAARALIADWLWLFRELADPADPRRCGLLADEGRERLLQAASPVLQALRAALPATCWSCEPLPRPVHTQHQAPAYRFMPDYDCWPIWFGPGSKEVGNVSPDELGLSWGLARHIEQWALEFDESLDRDDPAGPALWTPATYRRHCAEGEALAERMRQELDATDRREVRLVYEHPAKR